jgi:hypothetical protein
MRNALFNVFNNVLQCSMFTLPTHRLGNWLNTLVDEHSYSGFCTGVHWQTLFRKWCNDEQLSWFGAFVAYWRLRSIRRKNYNETFTSGGNWGGNCHPLCNGGRPACYRGRDWSSEIHLHLQKSIGCWLRNNNNFLHSKSTIRQNIVKS